MCNHQIPAKLYEYLRAGRPILALTDPLGNTADALREAGCHAIVDLADESSIEQGLRKWLHDLRAGLASQPSQTMAARHSRRARTAELATLLDEVCALP